jgi:TatD DNase family protein
MIFTDTHTHLYLEQFENDRHEVIRSAIDQGVKYMLLPNINSDTIAGMMELCRHFPANVFPMIGLHPTDVKENFEEELKKTEEWISKEKFYAIGETGIDLYWDKTFLKQQKIALKQQIAWAKAYTLPIVLHVRDSFDEVFEVLENEMDERLKGVFHCFTGTLSQAETIIGRGFKLGIGGVLTYPKSGLDKVIKEIPLEHILLETDAPFLSPAPFRGKRNQSAYIIHIARKLSEIKNIAIDEIAHITTKNASELFGFQLNGGK